jgi:D-beta-D-heptose 7-phosphate kinase/D-beta-D-heptose 1-phosphate adenosyltransferase
VAKPQTGGITAATLLARVDQFTSARVVVVGDVMLDHYLLGHVTRISPEAPWPVVDVYGDDYRLGGAANVAHNICALDASAALCGLIGDDDAGGRLRALLTQQGIATDGLVVDGNRRPTTVKMRIIGRQQQMMRVDRETRTPLPAGPVQRQLLDGVERALADATCLVLSDYAKGLFTEGLLKDVIQLAKRHRVKIVADPKVANFDAMKGATVVTPNHLEAMQIAAGRVKSTDDIMEVGHHLLERLDGEAVLITLGEHGMILFERGGAHYNIKTVAQQVFDVTGAGDTVAAVLALGLACGASMRESATLANAAAGVVVGKVGTATVDRQELRAALHRQFETTT